MKYVWLQPNREQYSIMHVKVAILVLVLARELNTSDTSAVVARSVDSVLCPTNKISVFAGQDWLPSINSVYLSSTILPADENSCTTH